MRWTRSSSHGFTFIELVMATAIMMILASAALPLARVSVCRQTENDLHRVLREVRTCIDLYKTQAELNRIPQDMANENYPVSLDVLVNGVPYNNDVTGRKFKCLRKIPIDPVTGTTDWGLRSYNDPPDAKSWGGQNVFDLYSKAEGLALDGSKFKDW